MMTPAPPRRRRGKVFKGVAQEEASVGAAPKSKQRRPRRRPANVWKRAEQTTAVEERTTLLLKNLERSCGTASLVERLDAEGLRGAYDFAYAPIDFNDQRAFGYAFVNFCSPERAREAAERLRTWAADLEQLEVLWTEHQGLAVQVSRYQNSPVMHESIPSHLKPMLFEDGTPVAFPAPTQVIQAPRSRRRGDVADAE